MPIIFPVNGSVEPKDLVKELRVSTGFIQFYSKKSYVNSLADLTDVRNLFRNLKAKGIADIGKQIDLIYQGKEKPLELVEQETVGGEVLENEPKVTPEKDTSIEYISERSEKDTEKAMKNLTKWCLFSPSEVKEVLDIDIKGMSYLGAQNYAERDWMGVFVRFFYVYKNLRVALQRTEVIQSQYGDFDSSDMRKMRRMDILKQEQLDWLSSNIVVPNSNNMKDMYINQSVKDSHKEIQKYNCKAENVRELCDFNIRSSSYFYINNLLFIPSISEGCKRFGIPKYKVDKDASPEERERTFISKYLEYRMQKAKGWITSFLQVEAYSFDDYYRCNFYNEIVYLTGVNIIWLRVLIANLGKDTDNMGTYASEKELCNFYNLPEGYWNIYLGTLVKENCPALYMIKSSCKVWKNIMKERTRKDKKLSIKEPYLKEGELAFKRAKSFDNLYQAMKCYGYSYIMIQTKMQEMQCDDPSLAIEELLLNRVQSMVYVFGITFNSLNSFVKSMNLAPTRVKKFFKEAKSTPDFEELLLKSYYSRRGIKLMADRTVGDWEIRRYSFTDSEGIDYFSCVNKEKGIMKNLGGDALMRLKISSYKETLEDSK